jgi:hypothetical protein
MRHDTTTTPTAAPASTMASSLSARIDALERELRCLYARGPDGSSRATTGAGAPPAAGTASSRLMGRTHAARVSPSSPPTAPGGSHNGRRHSGGPGASTPRMIAAATRRRRGPIEPPTDKEGQVVPTTFHEQLAAAERARHARLRRLWQMPPEQRAAAMRRGELTLEQRAAWSARYPEQMPMLNGEFEWIAIKTPEACE